MNQNWEPISFEANDVVTGLVLGFGWLWSCSSVIVQSGSDSSGKILPSDCIVLCCTNRNFNSVGFQRPPKTQIDPSPTCPVSNVLVRFVPSVCALSQLLPLGTPESTVPKVPSLLFNFIFLNKLQPPLPSPQHFSPHL